MYTTSYTHFRSLLAEWHRCLLDAYRSPNGFKRSTFFGPRTATEIIPITKHYTNVTRIGSAVLKQQILEGIEKQKLTFRLSREGLRCYAGTGVFKVFGVGWELPPNFQGFFIWGECPCPILF